VTGLWRKWFEKRQAIVLRLPGARSPAYGCVWVGLDHWVQHRKRGSRCDHRTVLLPTSRGKEKRKKRLANNLKTFIAIYTTIFGCADLYNRRRNLC
jgi:hypothetical protein